MDPASRPRAPRHTTAAPGSHPPPFTSSSSPSSRRGWRPPATRLCFASLPPLPEIACPRLARQAVTHKAALRAGGGAHDESEYDLELASYEPLESIGDRKLNWEVTVVVRRAFPRASSGPLENLVSVLVRNVTISHIAAAYRLADRAHLAPQSPPRDNQNLAADLFEAHVGALAEYELLHPLAQPVLDGWLRELFAPARFPDLEVEAERLIDTAMRPRPRRNDADRHRWTCARCDARAGSTVDPPVFTFDEFDQVKGWHVHVSSGAGYAGCATGRTRKDAEQNVLYSILASLE